MSTPDRNYQPAFPFPECAENFKPDKGTTIQFIVASISHAELGLSEDVQRQLTAHPDRIFARNIALYLFGFTDDERYKNIADMVEQEPNVLEMSEVAKSALTSYFDLKPLPESNSTNLTNESEPIPEISDDELRDKVRTEVWCSLSSLRVTIESSTGENLEQAKKDYDAELVLSIKRLIGVSDFESARDLAMRPLTREAIGIVQSEYDLAATNFIRGLSTVEELLQSRHLLGTLFSTYHKTTAPDIFDRKIFEIVDGLQPNDLGIQKALELSSVCLGDYGRSMMKIRCDNLILRAITAKLNSGDTEEAMALTSLLRTEHAKSKATELIFEQI